MLARYIDRTPAKKRWNDRFIDHKVSQYLAVVNFRFEQWNRSQDPGDWQRYSEAKELYSKIVSERKTEMYNSFVKELDNLQPNEMLRKLRSIRTRRSRACGALATTPEALAQYREYYQGQFTNSYSDRSSSIEYTPNLTASDFSGVLSLKRIEEEIKACAKGKATGETGIPVEALQISLEISARILHPIFEFAAKYQVVPSSWTKARIQPVPKKGDLTLISNYRPISLEKNI